MAHMLLSNDNMFSVRETPWHGKGAVLEDYPKSIEEALEKSGLTWKVGQGDVFVSREAFSGDPFQPLAVADEIAEAYSDGGLEAVTPAQMERYLAARRTVVGSGGLIHAKEFRGNVREDTVDVLGIVTQDYRVIQNEVAFKFLDAVIGSELCFETAGSLMNGKRVWCLVRMPEYIEVAGDQTGTYLYVANSHDGSMAVTAAVTPIRIVCNNTLSWALRKSEGAQSTFKFRHVGEESTLDQKFEEARKVMGLAVNYQERFKKLGDELGTKRMSPPQFQRDVLVKLFPIDRDAMGSVAIRNREESRRTVMDIFRGQIPGREATVGNAPGTAWCAANAVGEYADWYRRYVPRTDQMARSFEDTDIKDRGFQLVRQSVGV